MRFEQQSHVVTFQPRARGDVQQRVVAVALGAKERKLSVKAVLPALTESGTGFAGWVPVALVNGLDKCG